ncbi:MAG TPA: MFS transporter [Kofleriaceae bacterium]|nr:MFS transporter [Kofleriaceae bacterium]
MRFFRPAPDAVPIADAAVASRMYARWRLRVFLSITIGYTIYYVARLSTSVSKDAMISAGVVTIGEAGLLDTVFLWTYAIGKTANGFLADRLSPRRFFATALVVSAAANLAFGVSSGFVVLVALWALNGVAQSVGVPTSGVVMASWFAPRELGTRYSMWSMAHHLGEGLTFVFTAHLIGAATAAGAGTNAWRAAFLGPGLLAAVAGLLLYRTLADRPRSLGLPAVAGDDDAPVRALQLDVLRNPWVWTCGVASGLLYVSRYAINNWGVFYLQKACGYSIQEAGDALAIFPIVGIAGTLVAGPISDRLGGRRVPVAIAYGLVLSVSLAVFYTAEADERWRVWISLACGGLAMGGLLAFLGGLIAIELCAKRAAGAALGIVGGFSYLGAGLQSLASSWLIERRELATGVSYDFTAVKYLWLGAPVAVIVLTAALWRAERDIKR